MLAIVLFGVNAYADWDEYHEVEENTPAYQDGSVNNNGGGYSSMPIDVATDNNRYSYWNQVVKVATSDGGWRYTTRKYATQNDLRYSVVSNNYNQDGRWGNRGGWNPGYSTVGKRFYPNSNYKREVKIKKKYGIISSVLNWLI